VVVIAAAFNAEQENVAPADTAVYTGSNQLVPVAPLNLTGAWQDAEGGNYRMVQQGYQVAFQGMSPHGPVTGAGVLQNNQLGLDYTLNGYRYQANLLISPDGASLAGQYRDPATGESGPVHMQRIR